MPAAPTRTVVGPIFNLQVPFTRSYARSCPTVAVGVAIPLGGPDQFAARESR